MWRGSDRRQAHWLAMRVPAYMVAYAWHMLTELPLLPNGKLDRRSLPTPAAFEPRRELPFVEARTPAEAQLAAIWAEVLEVKWVSDSLLWGTLTTGDPGAFAPGRRLQTLYPAAPAL
jgi:hypothetical protein